MKIAILGCGVAGLSAARELARNGIDAVLFDKSRGVGGRMSTRYAEAWEFDHGAQYFTIQDADFQTEIDRAIKAGVVSPWTARALYLKTGNLSADTGRARYVGNPRMNSLPKYWADGLNVNLGKRVASLAKTENWELSFEDGTTQSGFDGVISTLPPAQAEKIIPHGFSVGTIVVHSEASWSDIHVDADRAWIEDVMLKSASALLGMPLDTAPHTALHRWLYASSKSSPDVPCLKGDGLVVAGDWCLGGRVQGAWLSGRAAAQAFT